MKICKQTYNTKIDQNDETPTKNDKIKLIENVLMASF